MLGHAHWVVSVGQRPSCWSVNQVCEPPALVPSFRVCPVVVAQVGLDQLGEAELDLAASQPECWAAGPDSAEPVVSLLPGPAGLAAWHSGPAARPGTAPELSAFGPVELLRTFDAGLQPHWLAASLVPFLVESYAEVWATVRDLNALGE